MTRSLQKHCMHDKIRERHVKSEGKTMKDDKVMLTFSSVLNKNGKPMVAVRFERDTDYAEGSVPECKITKSNGFSADEISMLNDYLVNNKGDIISRAKSISGISHLLG